MFPAQLQSSLPPPLPLLNSALPIYYYKCHCKASKHFFFHLTGLGHLCEFIEDCEHTVLATRILHLLGREGPRSQNPSKYIRFIYNRVILENAAVRAGKNYYTSNSLSSLPRSWVVMQWFLPPEALRDELKQRLRRRLQLIMTDSTTGVLLQFPSKGFVWMVT